MLEFSEGQMHFVALRKTYLKDYYYYYYYYHYARKFIAFGSNRRNQKKIQKTILPLKPLKLHMHLANLETLLKGCLTPTNSEFFRPKCFQTELE